MQILIFLASLIATVIALPIPQAGAGIGDILSGSAGGVNGLTTGGVNNVANDGGNSVADVSGSAGDLITRSPQVGAGTGDVLSGTAGGLNALLSGGANNLLNNAGNSVADVSGSAGDLITRSPEPQVGTDTSDVLSGTGGGANSLRAGGANNDLNSAGNSAANVSSSAGNLVN